MARIAGPGPCVRHRRPLRQRLSDVRFQIVGRHSSPAVRELANQAGVEVVGEVDDLRKALARSTAVVAPLQMARGIQNKVLEAMASQRVVVCSPAAFTGIDAQLGRDVLLAREPQQWTDLLEHVLVDEAFRRRLAEAARRHVMRRYGWAQALEPMARVLVRQDPRWTHNLKPLVVRENMNLRQIREEEPEGPRDC